MNFQGSLTFIEYILSQNACKMVLNGVVRTLQPPLPPIAHGPGRVNC